MKKSHNWIDGASRRPMNMVDRSWWVTPALGLVSVDEFLPGYEASTWNGVCAPKNAPAEIIDRLNSEINASLANPKIGARPAEAGASPLSASPADFGKHIAAEIEKWRKKVIRVGPIKRWVAQRGAEGA